MTASAGNTTQTAVLGQAPALPQRPGQAQRWSNLHGSAAALRLHQAMEHAGRGLLVILTQTPGQAQQIETELRFFASGGHPEILSFPDWETLPYDVFSPHQDIVSERLRTLARLRSVEHAILVVPMTTFLQRLPPRTFVAGHVLDLTVGGRLDPGTSRRELEQAGYRCVPEVNEHGEFAIRGSVVDIFPMGSDQPIRVDLFDQEIETIRHFDPETQLGGERIASVSLLPGREFPVDEAAITRFRSAFRARFEGDPTRCRLYREVSEGHFPGGVETYLPLFHEETASLFDYLPEQVTLFLDGDVVSSATTVWSEVVTRYEQRRHDPDRPLPEPAELYLAPEALSARLSGFRRIERMEETPEAQTRGPAPGLVRHPTRTLPTLRMDAAGAADGSAGLTLPDFLDTLVDAAQATRILFVAESSGHREALLETLRRLALLPEIFPGFRAFLEADARLGMVVSPMERGVWLTAPPGLLIITEAMLYPNRVQQRRRRRRQEKDPTALIRDLTELQIDAPVVHEEHGVGRYLGLQRLTVANQTNEFLTIGYADDAKLYVPVASLHLVSRYTGGEADHAPLHRLGSGQWEKARRRAAERVRDVAAELLDIHARRAARQGVSMRVDAAEYARFAAQFPFEETPDQQDAIDAVLNDLAGDRPMDRVICGDVGFGKTEVAMRAAFVAVHSGYQVVVLAPTTLLARQHFQTFRDRFADWPVRIGQLSRFVETKTQKSVLSELESGRIDIVIGTHKLLQDDVRAERLGLVIIDEEHRFGVRQKERMKSLRAEVDLLTLTATPIPRTLNMALAGIRELSIIATPPARRLAVKTFVNEWDDGLIQEACLREFKRGGQVYFLHNDVKHIERMAARLRELLPTAELGVAHGQLPERELERVMLDFYHQRFNLLLCSTIIESGIDIPTANTIIINRADRFGLAQLHQMRGRVGRSHHRAYAYLIAPPRAVMTADADRRLQALAALEDLGAGFNLASHDLEIRGAGELLGSEQSGEISEVGFALYNDLLERAIRDLKAGRKPLLDAPIHHGCDLELRIPALIPESYLPDVHTRLVLYKRIATAEDGDGLRDLQIEMIDRFGLLPEPAKHLFAIAELKQKATALGLARGEFSQDGGSLEFGPDVRIDPAQLVALLRSQPQWYRLERDERLRVLRPSEDAATRLALVDEVLESLIPGRSQATGRRND